MNPRLQAGIELELEKTAAEEAGTGLLAGVLRQKAAAAGLLKLGVENQGVEQTLAGGAGTPSSNSSPGMEEKNKGFGKGPDYKLDDDPSKGGKETGATVNAVAGTNITTEPSGMPNLEIGTKQHKNASGGASVLTTMLQGFVASAR